MRGTLLDALRALVFRRDRTVPEIAERAGLGEKALYKAAAPHEETGVVGHRSLDTYLRIMEASEPRPLLDYLARRFGYRLRKSRRRASGCTGLAKHAVTLAAWQQALAVSLDIAPEGRDLERLEKLLDQLQAEAEDFLAGLAPQPSLPLEDEDA